MAEQRHRGLRVTLAVIGGVGVLLAVLIDLTPWGQPGSLGSGQVLLLLSGLIVLLIAILGGRFGKVYTDFAIVFVNSLVLLGLLELTAIALTRLGVFRQFETVDMSRYSELPYYEAQEWSDVYWKEANHSEAYEYSSYVGWVHLPFSGETVNVNEQRRRVTPGSECDSDTYRIFAFGGSSMWGWGAPDWHTIPAYLQRELKRGFDRSICVVNYGEDGFVSTQEVILLLEELQRGNVPDAVLFYDGVNEVTAADLNGQPRAHVRLGAMRKRLETHPLRLWLERSRLYWLLSHVRPGSNTDDAGAGCSDDNLRGLCQYVADTYLGNYRVVSALASAYGYQFFFFWQPHLAVEAKKLSPEEGAMRARMNPRMANLGRGIYARVAAAADTLENLWYIADTFEPVEKQIWIDEWGHVTPEGNAMIARRMAELIEANRSKSSSIENADDR